MCLYCKNDRWIGWLTPGQVPMDLAGSDLWDVEDLPPPHPSSMVGVVSPLTTGQPDSGDDPSSQPSPDPLVTR